MQSHTFFVPSAVSSFFEICDHGPDGQPIRSLLHVGARGGGFRIADGSWTSVETLPEHFKDEVYINGQPVDGKTSHRVLDLMRRTYDFTERVHIRHHVRAPIGAGFGTSGAGALGTALALADALGLQISQTRLGQIAHVAEILSVTGLGTVVGLVEKNGSVGLVTEPGAPDIGQVAMIPCDAEDYRLVTITYGPIDKRVILYSEAQRQRVNGWGRRTLERILECPTPENLLRQSRWFAEQTGIATCDLLDLADFMTSKGAIGASQNMIGKAVHALVPCGKLESLSAELERVSRPGKILVSRLDGKGPRMATELVASHERKPMRVGG